MIDEVKMMTTELLNELLVKPTVTSTSISHCAAFCWSLTSAPQAEEIMLFSSLQAQTPEQRLPQSHQSAQAEQPKIVTIEQPKRGFGLRQKLENNRMRLGISTSA
jgi:hypothetical protein